MRERIIYLVRHGKVLLDNNERRYVGQIDVPLADEGVRQASLLCQALCEQDIDYVFCSDLIRSIDTANIIAAGLKKETVARFDLREIGMGSWEGKTFADIERYYPGEHAKRGHDIINYRVPGGESFADCLVRVNTALSDIMGLTTGNILIVGHAGINRLLLCQILGMPLVNLFRISQDYGCLNIIINSGTNYRVQRLNSPAFIEVDDPSYAVDVRQAK